MLKRWIAVAMALWLAAGLSGLQGLAEGLPEALSQETSNEQAMEAAEPQQPIVISAPTQCSGYFFTDMWGNNSMDIDIRSMLHGYGIVTMGIDGVYQLDSTVVEDLTSEDDADGGRTYTVTIAQGMTYNNGVPITAADYVFSVLLQSDPSIPMLGGTNVNYSHLKGHADYASGASGVLSGIRLLSDNRFSVAVPAEALPYYYEMVYVSAAPYPISVIAPGYTVRDDGQGAYLAVETAEGIFERRALTAELLQATLLSQNGYAHEPRVTSGPYQLVEYDRPGSAVTMEINPLYRGNHQGRKPEVAQVKVIPLLDHEGLDAFESGSVQIVHRLVTGDAIDRAITLSDEGQGEAIGYLRSGYAFFAFACEQVPMDDARVRTALAMCVDREAICNTLLSGYAVPVNGYYGWGQWMTGRSTQELTKYDDVSYNVNEARRLLEKAGFVYDEGGERYRVGLDTIRYKKGAGGVLIPLEIRWAKTETVVTDTLEEMLTPIFAELGVSLKITPVTFAEMLREYYRQDGQERSNNLFFLSTNFYQTFDPYHTYHTGDAWQGVFNTSGLRSEALMNAARDLRMVAANDDEAYLVEWLAFQDAWHQEMPTAPIYSNVYYDLCTPLLTDYQPSAHVGLGDAIVHASYATEEEEAPEGASTEEALDGGDAGIMPVAP